MQVSGCRCFEPFRVTVFGLVAIGLLAGCGDGPPAVSLDPVDVSAATEQAFQMSAPAPAAADSGNASSGAAPAAPSAAATATATAAVPKDAINAATADPAMRALAVTADKDGDGVVTRAEFQTRLRQQMRVTTGFQAAIGTVTLGGRPLNGAQVTFVPARFLAGSRQPATGVTDAEGMFELSTEGTSLPGIGGGVYLVVISKRDQNGNELVPARYNVSTELGAEVSADLPSHFEFNLKK